MNAGTARIDKMFNVAMATTLQNVHKTYQVALHVCRWVIQRIPYTRLGGKMDDAANPFLLEYFAQYIRVGDVGLDESKAGVFAQSVQAGFLQSHIVISVDIIYAYYFIAAS